VRYTGCGPCIRARAEDNLLDHLARANVLWPAVAVKAAQAVVESFRPGHAPEIQRLMEQSRRSWTAASEAARG
jgi:hypothetical protein